MSAPPIHPPGPHDRFAFLDVLRGLAALMVFVQHGLEKGGFESLERGAVATAWLNLGETGVALFFLISGFIIPASVREGSSLREFGVRRVLRIYPLYWSVFAATYLFAAVALPHRETPLPLVLASHAVFVQEWVRLPNYVAGSWTLFIEMAWYAAFAAALFSGYGAGVRLLRAFLAAHAAITVLAALFWPEFPLGRLAIFALCFLGYAYLLFFEGRLARGAFVRLLAGFLALILSDIVIRFYGNPSQAFGAPSFRCVLDSWGIALALFPLLLWRRGSRIANAPALRYLGRISYSLYLVHSLVMDVLVHLGLSGAPFLLLAAGLTLGVSALTYRAIEEPGIALARRVARRIAGSGGRSGAHAGASAGPLGRSPV